MFIIIIIKCIFIVICIVCTHVHWAKKTILLLYKGWRHINSLILNRGLRHQSSLQSTEKWHSSLLAERCEFAINRSYLRLELSHINSLILEICLHHGVRQRMSNTQQETCRLSMSVYVLVSANKMVSTNRHLHGPLPTSRKHGTGMFIFEIWSFLITIKVAASCLHVTPLSFKICWNYIKRYKDFPHHIITQAVPYLHVLHHILT